MIIDWTIGAIQQLQTHHGRSVWNWSGVSAAEGPTVGPWRVAAARVHVAGAQEAPAFVAGQQTANVLVAGAQEGEGSG